MLRKTNLLFAVILICGLIFSGCSDDPKETPQEPDPKPNPGGEEEDPETVYFAKVNGEILPLTLNTRVDITQDGFGNIWAESDEIGVYYLPEDDEDIHIVNRKFQLNKGAGETKGEFTSATAIQLSDEAVKHPFLAVYPYNQTAGADMSAITVELPTDLSLSGNGQFEGSYDFLIAAATYESKEETRAENEVNEEIVEIDLQFEYPFSLIKFVINAEGSLIDDETLDSFTISSDVNFVGATLYNLSERTFATPEKSEVNIEFDAEKSLNEEITIYMQVYPVDMTSAGFELGFITENYDAEFTVPVTEEFEGGKIYTVTANLQDLIDAGKGELEYTGEPLVSSNSYIMRPEEVLEIPVTRAYEVWKEYLNTDLSGPVTVNILWQSERELITSVLLTKGDRGVNSRIRVEAGTAEGNAVVTVSVGGTVRWGYHLWITSADIEGLAHDWNGYTWMDRFLGALSVERAFGEYTWGLYYQWGRQYPTPAGYQSAEYSNSQLPFYNEAGEVLSMGETQNEEDATLEFSLSNPLTHMDLQNWSGNDGATSWEKNGKTVFDPCPDGWRVPYSETSPWDALTTAGWTRYSSGVRGHMINEINAWYPASGGYYHTSGGTLGIQMGGSASYTWFARSNTDIQAYYLNMYFSPAGTSSAPKKYGHTIRCVKE